MKHALLLSLLILATSSPLIAAEPATKPTSQPVALDMADKAAITAATGREVIISGAVTEAQWSSSKKVFLIKFKEGADTGFQVAIFAKTRDDMEKAFGDLTKAFEGGKIKVTGKLQVYRDKPEILVSDPKQIVVWAKPPATTQP